MTKFHINPDTGRPNLCGADSSNPKARGCPYKNEDGGPATHYSSKEEARTAYEKENISKTFSNITQSKDKTKTFNEEKYFPKFNKSTDVKINLSSISNHLDISYKHAQRLWGQNIIKDLIRPTSNYPYIDTAQLTLLKEYRQKKLPNDKDNILIINIGPGEDNLNPPSLFINSDKKSLNKNENTDGFEIKETAPYQVSDEAYNVLKNNGGVVLSSYSGFILSGGIIDSSESVMFNGHLRHTFKLRPFTEEEEKEYLGTYEEPKPGPTAVFKEKQVEEQSENIKKQKINPLASFKEKFRKKS